MSINSNVEEVKENIINDLEDRVFVKEENMPITIVEEKRRSLNIGVIGTGQAGSRLAESFAKLGYTALVFNTASQDLKFIDLPDENKFLLEYGLGGAAKDLTIGKEAAETNKESILALVQNKLEDAQVFMLCLSLGGGSGAGSCETIIDVLVSFGKPILVMTVIPMSGDDAQTKRNALETLAKLSRLAQNKVIHNLIVVDNAKIETLYSDVGHMDFFGVSNRAIVEPIDAFNTLSAKPSKVKALDSMEFAKIMTDGGGLSSYGQTLVKNYEDESAIAEAVIGNLSGGLLSSGFDLKQAKYVGVIVEANKKVWDKIPASSMGYAMSQVHEICSTPDGAFFGSYESDSMKDDGVKVYSIFSGLGLPDTRVQQLKKEVLDLESVVKSKEVERNLTLKLETGTEETVSAADKARQNIAKKKSAFGSLVGASVQDRRKK